MAENATASAETTMPAFVRAGMDFFTGKTVLKTTFDEVSKALETANARIDELEKIDAKALTDRIAALEGDIKAKDETIAGHVKTISRLEGEFKTAARQAQEQIARSGATPPVVTDAPKNPEGKDEAAQFIEAYSARISKGETKSAALSALVRENPKLHVAFIMSGKQLP